MQEKNKIEFSIIKGLGPSILKAKIPKDIVDKLNSYVDELIVNKKKSITLNHGNHLVGDVTQEFKVEEEIMKVSGWANFLSVCVSNWIQRETGNKITKFHILNSWIVRQFKNEYNPIHWHGGHISGVAYLKVPEKLNHENSKKHIHKNGNIEFVHGSTQFLSSSTFTLKPEIGDLYIFPHYLMHTVYPFYGEGERRSVSFNSFIDDKIFNVHNN